jgi:hypothetical protein
VTNELNVNAKRNKLLPALKAGFGSYLAEGIYPNHIQIILTSLMLKIGSIL